MSPKLVVVDGASLKCSKGALPSMLTVTTPSDTEVGEAPVATIMDYFPGTNIKPFGVCAIKGGPCVPVTLMPWFPGEPSIPLVPSIFPILSDVSNLTCAVGGVIRVAFPGQSTFFVDSENGTEVPPSLLESFLDIGFAFDATWGVSSELGKGLYEFRARRFQRWANIQFARAGNTRLKLPLDWRAKQFGRGWSFIKQGYKAKAAAKALGFLGVVPDLWAIKNDVDGKGKRDVKGAVAKGIGIGVGIACGVVASPTGPLGLAACGLAGAVAGRAADYAIKNPKKTFEIVAKASPVLSSAKWAMDNRKNIYNAGKHAAGAVADVGEDAAGVVSDIGKGTVKNAKSVLRRIPKPSLPKLW